MLHAFKLPFTGTIVSGFAVCIIVLLGRFSGSKQILKATIIVCIFKLALSPHSPPTAYLAVAFQGCAGAVLIRINSTAYFPPLVFGLLALTESACQRLFLIWLLYGQPLWTAINEFIDKTLGGLKHADYAGAITITYVLIHVIAGIFVGIYAANISRKIAFWKNDSTLILKLPETNSNISTTATKKKLPLVFLIWMMLLLVSVVILMNGELFSNHYVLPRLLIRSMLIAGFWFFILRPIFQKYFSLYLNRKKNGYAEDIREIELILPFAKNIFMASVRDAGKQVGMANKLNRFWMLLFSNFLFADVSGNNLTKQQPQVV